MATLVKKKRYTKFRPKVRSMHPSHDVLRTELPLLPFKSVVRLGSTTELEDGKDRVECNSVRGVSNSASKLLMKQCFTKAGVRTADCYTSCYPHTRNLGDQYKWEFNYMQWVDPDLAPVSTSQLEYPIIAKHVNGSRGTGNYKLDNEQQLRVWMETKDLSQYIFEKFYNYNREYRLHVTKEGCFYTCRKVLKSDTPTNKRWFRNDSNCNWLTENHEKFDKPINWNDIVNECVKAINSLELDICCFDVKVQSAFDKRGNMRDNPEFIVIESGSAPSFGDLTAVKYLEKIPEILIKKYVKR